LLTQISCFTLYYIEKAKKEMGWHAQRKKKRRRRLVVMVGVDDLG
jgi:hypothetical protein